MQFLEKILYAVVVVLFILFVRWASVDIVEVFKIRTAVLNPVKEGPVEGQSVSAETPPPSQMEGQ